MNARLVSTAADVIARAMENGRQTPAGWAVALDCAQLLQSPETAAEVDALRARLAGELASPLAWARLLDVKSLDNFMCALGMAADTDPADGALSQVEEMIRSFRSAVAPGAEEERSETLHDHIVARDAEVERLRARVTELEADLAAKAQDTEAAVKGWERARACVAELEARLAEYERPADEDPITYTLTDKAPGDVTPQVAKLRALLAGQREQTGGAS